MLDMILAVKLGLHGSRLKGEVADPRQVVATAARSQRAFGMV